MATHQSDIKKLGRAELLELLIMQTEENEQMAKKIAELEEKLGDRQIKIETSGSIAEASLKLNSVFEAAQAAADEYLENIKRQNQIDENESLRIKAEAKGEAEEIIAAANEEAERIVASAKRVLSEAEVKCRAMEKETARKCEETTRLARKASDGYWDAVMSRMHSEDGGRNG